MHIVVINILFYFYVSLFLQSFKEILAGKYDDLPEAAFYMQGSIEDVIEKAEQLAAQAS